MAVKKINRDDPFQIPCENFIISATSSGYTMNYSADGNTGNAWKEASDANKNQVVIGLPINTYVKLVGNTDNNILIRG